MRKFLQLLLVACLAGVLPFILLWNYRLFATSLNPFLGGISAFMSILIGVLIAVRLIKRRAQNRAYAPAILFAVGSASCLFAALPEALLLGGGTFDIQLDDTYYVLAFHHLMQAFAIIFSVFSAIYYWYPKWFGRPLNAGLAYIHFWVTFVAAYFIFLPDRYQSFGYGAIFHRSMAGMARRYMNDSSTLPPENFYKIDWLLLIAVTGLFLAQFLFLFNFFYSLVRPARARRSL